MACRRVILTRCHVILLGVGSAVVIVTALSLLTVEVIVHKKVAQKVSLVVGSETYDEWVEPSLPIYMQFYVFGVDNPKAILAGGRPKVSQRGPYTYQEHRHKVDISHNDNGTVTYRQIKTYHFVRNMSIGPDAESFVTVNLPLVTIANFVKWKTEGWHSLAQIADKVGGGLFIKKTVRQMAFGYKDRLLTLGMVFDPSRFYTNLVGILAGKNNTDDGVYTIFTGKNDITKLGVIDKYNGTNSLRFWTTDCANKINGSDGTVVPPFVESSQRLYMFSTDICRSVYGVYAGRVPTSSGVELYKFSGPRDVMANASENPDNAGFCTPRGRCMGAGVLNLTSCQSLDHFSVPMVASYPHFYLADQKYVRAIDGMQPDATQHSTYINLEPTTGIVAEVAKRLQINVYIENITDIHDFQNLHGMVFPILWINESVMLDRSHLERIQLEVLEPVRIAYLVHYGLLALGGLLLLMFCSSLLATAVCAKPREPQSHSVNGDDDDDRRETDPLLT